VITAKSSLTDVAYAVCTALDRAGSRAVLTGGSAATFYAPEAYQSFDLDFVLVFSAEAGGAEALRQLGFSERGGTYWHARSKFSLDFPRGPLAIGDELITSWSTVRRRHDVLHVLTPTDCCRDRLASWLFWNDFAGLEQALAVWRARRAEVDLARIERWCRAEGQAKKYELFKSRLA